ncbi:MULTISPECIES: FtsL-like putative cell division protein [Persicobacter]|uniref:S-adenosyl-methyltransferase n=1 Tax=Persicobacter diffluens TaxID=981 RepID=A0AAN4VWH8_9BACT|nr:FtsL-like putative cell division protein [Persicobacter sp. CCB-QB2]GJM60529.1 hypothetical protein PEDI_10810 [Persicobacter diffluens]
MRENTFRNPTKPKVSRPRVATKGQRKKKKGLFTMVERLFERSYLGRKGIDLQLLKPWLMIMVLGIVYIFNSHYAEKTSRKIDKLQKEVRDLRSQYTTLKYSYMYSSKQSEVAKKVQQLGLEESEVPPFKIIVKEK